MNRDFGLTLSSLSSENPGFVELITSLNSIKKKPSMSEKYMTFLNDNIITILMIITIFYLLYMLCRKKNKPMYKLYKEKK